MYMVLCKNPQIIQTIECPDDIDNKQIYIGFGVIKNEDSIINIQFMPDGQKVCVSSDQLLIPLHKTTDSFSKQLKHNPDNNEISVVTRCFKQQNQITEISSNHYILRYSNERQKYIVTMSSLYDMDTQETKYSRFIKWDYDEATDSYTKVTTTRSNDTIISSRIEKRA